jgi:signal transduction histidine kinase/ligand-binding sensor domain-containing protein
MRRIFFMAVPMRYALFVFVIAVWASRAHGAGTPAFAAQTWMAENGLPDNSVSGLAQTPDGYLWVATQSSLTRFDGLDFIPEPLGETAAVSSRLIRALYADRRGAVWAALESGPVLCFSAAGVSTVPIANATTRDWAERICEDRAGTIWLAYQRGGVCRLENGVPIFMGEKEGVPLKSRGCICADRDGVIWLAEGDELAIYRGGRFINLARNLAATGAICARRQGGVWLAGVHGFREYTEEAGLGPERPFPNRARNYDVSVILEDRTGRVWVGNFGGGLLCWNGDAIFEAPTPTDDIFALVEDRDGNLWVGAEGGGLTRLRARRARLVSVAQGLPSSAAFSLASDPSSVLWIVSRDGEVVRQPPDAPLLRLPHPPWNASCIATGLHGEVWVGTGNLGLFSWGGESYSPVGGDSALAGDSVRALFTTSAGDLLISGQTSGVHRLRAGKLATYPSLGAKDYVRAFAEDSKHGLWAGTLAGRLLQIHEDDLEDVTPAAFPSPASIRTLLAGAQGGLWIGFAKQGIGRLAGRDFARAGAEEGLWSDAVSQALEDGYGNLWMGGDRGYFRISIADFDALAAGRSKRVRSELFGRPDDIPAVQASFSHFPSAARLPDGELAFATSAGALLVDAKSVAGREQKLPVYLRSIEIDGRRQSLPPDGERVAIPAQTQRLSIDFTAVSLSAPENVYFRYWLQGYDGVWSEPGKERRATYSRLPPGSYTFRVTACDESGSWNDAGATIAFKVAPTLWQTVWFRVLGLLVFTSLVAFGVRHLSLRRVRRRLREAEQKAILERERARIARDMHDELGATLTRIALLGDLQSSSTASPEQPGAQAGMISLTARSALKSLDEIVWAVNPLNDSVNHLLEYLGQYAAEYLCAAGIRCRLEFPEAVSTSVVPGDARHHFFLAAKEVLHNTVKHSGAAEVSLRAELSAAALTLRIEDDGCGFEGEPADRFANGLKNIASRLAQSGGAARIESAAGRGTRVTLVMPCQSE